MGSKRSRLGSSGVRTSDRWLAIQLTNPIKGQRNATAPRANYDAASPEIAPSFSTASRRSLSLTIA